MKIPLVIFLGLLFVSCNKQKAATVKTAPAQSVAPLKDSATIAITVKGTSKVAITLKDTTKITITVNNEHLEYTESELKGFEEYFNELIDKDFPVEPKIAYTKSRGFESEVGQDTFYILYTYFLQQKNGIKPHDAIRKKLLNLFTSINELNKNLQYGGTYFMHQYSRINGYVEYEVYLSIDDDWYTKKYSIAKQKNMFLESLRQHVLDEEEFDYNTLGKEKIMRRKKLLKMIDEIGSQIITFHDLRKAQEFQYSYYNWL